jgi:hypothetical protein
LDLHRAAEFYRAAANRNDAEGQYNYGFCLQYGFGTGVDLEEAASYYKKSADQKHGCGAFHYGLCIHYGIGVERDVEEAAKYYQLFDDCHRSPAATYYEMSSKNDTAKPSFHSFRCRRIQMTAEFRLDHLPPLSPLRVQFLEECISLQSFSASTMISDCLVESRASAGGRVIGTGGAALVTLQENGTDGRKIAIKQITTPVFNPEQFIREVEISVKLNHPCVLRIVGFAMPSESLFAEIHTEYAENGSLEKVMKRVNLGSIPHFWNPTGKCIIISGIVLGMIFMHSHGSIDRDLKPGNIMINKLGRALIGDFGTSCINDDEGTLPGTATGTVNYAAPELFQEIDPPTNKARGFSFGVIMYEILLASLVFSPDEARFEVMKRILHGEMPPIPEKCRKLIEELIPKCWSKNPESRLSFAEILDEFPRNDFSLVPGANARVIHEYVRGVLTLEARPVQSPCSSS